MPENVFQIPGLPSIILKLLIFGALLWLFFFIFKKFVILLPFRKSYPAGLMSYRVYRLSIKNIILIIEVVCWTLFAFWAVDIVFKGNRLFALIFSILLFFIFVGISWSVIRDFILGVIIKLERAFSINEWFKVTDSHGRDVEGRIKKLGYRSLEIETEKGETVDIPYSVITKELVVSSSRHIGVETVKSYTFVMEVPKNIFLHISSFVSLKDATDATGSVSGETPNDNPETSPVKMGFKEIKEKIRMLILNSHWASLKREPQIKLLEETNDNYTLQITIYTMEDKYFQEIESYLKSELVSS
ncbi:MAG: mechanosensitive ion channel domain-containing protein, partial [Bacteroidota bacterium]